MDTRFEIQMSLYTRIANSYKNFKQKGVAKMTKSNATVRLAGLESDYKSFMSNHFEILSTCGDKKEHDYFTSKLSERAEDTYY